MKMIDTRPDLDLAPARESAGRVLKNAVLRLFTLLRALKNRRAVMRLEDFTDQQLTDIGLSRSDVEWSLRQPWYDDPSTHLARSAWRRRAAHRDAA